MISYIKIYDNILKIDNLNLTDKLILSLILNYLENDNIFMLSNSQISKRLNISLRSVNYSLNDLLNKKFISCEYGDLDGINSNRFIKIIDKKIIDIKDDYIKNKDFYKAFNYFKDTYKNK